MIDENPYLHWQHFLDCCPEPGLVRCCLDVRQVAFQVWQQQVCLQVWQQQLQVCLQVFQQQLQVCLACQRKQSKNLVSFITYPGFTCDDAGALGSHQKEKGGWQRKPAQVIMVRSGCGLVWYKPRGEAASCLLVCRGVRLWPSLASFYPQLASSECRNIKRMRSRPCLGFPLHDLLYEAIKVHFSSQEWTKLALPWRSISFQRWCQFRLDMAQESVDLGPITEIKSGKKDIC